MLTPPLVKTAGTIAAANAFGSVGRWTCVGDTPRATKAGESGVTIVFMAGIESSARAAPDRAKQQ